MMYDQAKIEKDITQGWVAGLISCVVTILFFGFFLKGKFFAAENCLMMIDIGLALLLTYGIYKKSRFAAVTMLIYFVLNRIYWWSTVGIGSHVGLGVIMIIMFYRGVRGTFNYHETAWYRDTATQNDT